MNRMMNILSAVLFTTISLSANGWQFTGGTGLWNLSADGTIVHQASSDLFRLDEQLTDNMNRQKDKTRGYLYVVVRHPIGYLPELRLEYAGVEGSGSINYFATDFFGTTYAATADSQLLLDQYDAILFYNVLDKFYWMTVDLGVDLKFVRSQYRVPDIDVDSASDSIIPMAYLRGRIEAPFAPIGLESDLKYITDGESTVYDIRIKVDYRVKLNDSLQPGVEVGYRIQQFTVFGENSNYLGDTFSGKSDTDVMFSGIYGGINAQF